MNDKPKFDINSPLRQKLMSAGAPGTTWQSLRKFWPLILPVLVILPGITGFPYPSPAAEFSDMAISHYPNAIFLRESILRWQALPLWSPTILSGYPFAANPLSGIWYPPGWLALVLPLPLGFNLVIMLHLFIGGIGMYKLLESEGITHQAALFGGMAFAALPKLYAHYGAGHLTLLYALSWTPWLLYFANTAQKQCTPKAPGLRDLFRLAILPALFYALIFLADVRWAAFAVVLWWVYVLVGPLPDQLRELPVRKNLYSLINIRDRASRIWLLLVSSCLAFLFTAPLAIPLWEYSQLSTRSKMTLDDFFTFSMPIPRLLGLFYPDLGGFHEWLLYPGALVLLLAFVSLLWKTGQSRSWFWAVTVVITLLYALGSNFPPNQYLAQIPGLTLLRVPSRALFLTGIALIILATYGLERVLEGPGEKERHRADLGISAVVLFMVVFAGAVWVFTSSLPLNFAWGAGFAFVGGRWLGARMWGRLTSRLWLPFLLVIALLDWTAVNYLAYASRSTEKVLSEQSEIANYIERQEGIFRIYSPSYSMPQQTGVVSNMQQVDGVDPLQLRAVTEFMEAASGVPNQGYSVTLPPFEGGDPQAANADYTPDPALLGLLNTRYVLAEFDLDTTGLRLVGESGGTRIYENLLARPRAWVQNTHSNQDASYKAVTSIDWQPNQIRVQADGPGYLVLSEITYPGWRVSVDGEAAILTAIAGILRAVQLEEGRHEVIFAFRPVSLYWGLALLGLGVIWVAIALAVNRR